MATKRTPRWWRRFMVASRRSNIFLWLGILSAAALVAVIILTWFAFTKAPPNGQLLPTARVASLLIGALIPSLALLILFGRWLALKRAAGNTARLHVRLVFFFSMIAAVPTLLVAAFAAVLFQSGVDFWFSDNSRGLMENARQLADSYYRQNQQDVGEETVTMAGDLRYYLSRLDNVTLATMADENFADLVAYQMQGRDISESVIMQRVAVLPIWSPIRCRGVTSAKA